MNNEPYKVSILVPIYGVEKYIEKCVRSIFKQTYQNLEIIFLDDCTPDNSIEILRQVLEDYSIRKSQVRIIKHEYNRGLAASRNTLIDSAKGKFVYHLDSDDWIEPDTIKLLVDKQIESNADIVSAHMYINDSEKDPHYIEPAYSNKDAMLVNILGQMYHHELAGRLINRLLYIDNNIHSFEGVNQAEDWRVTPMLIYYANNIALVNKFLYHYVMTTNSYCRSAKPWNKQKISLMQDLQNYGALETFFKNKNDRYHSIVSSLLPSRIYNIMMKSIENEDKLAYYQMRSKLLSYKDNLIINSIGRKLFALINMPFSYYLISYYLNLAGRLWK